METYAKQGHRIVFQYFQSEDEAKQLLSDAQKNHWEIRGLQLDVRDTTFPETFIQFAIAEFGDIHLLINNASTFHTSPLEKLTLEEFDENMHVNLRAPVLLTQAFARHAKAGHIINMVDCMITSHRTDQISYLLSKKALAEFTKLAARALAPHIRVNAIAPGRMLTPVNVVSELRTPEQIANAIPLARMGNPNDITTAIDALEKLTYTTGEILFVSGGKELG